MIFLGWILSAATIAGALMNVMKIKWGFIVWIVANMGWIYLNVTEEFYEQIPVWITLTIISIYGFAQWSRQDRRDTAETKGERSETT